MYLGAPDVSLVVPVRILKTKCECQPRDALLHLRCDTSKSVVQEGSILDTSVLAPESYNALMRGTRDKKKHVRKVAYSLVGCVAARWLLESVNCCC